MENGKYTVIVSDRAKHMLGMHIRFMTQINKPAAAKIKEEIMNAMRSLPQYLLEMSLTLNCNFCKSASVSLGFLIRIMK